MADFKAVADVCASIRTTINLTPEVGVICGSGLGQAIVALVVRPLSLPYSEIAGFPVCTVLGHEGQLVFGQLGGKSVVVMQGRFHPYEGYTHQQIALPIRVMHMLGARKLFITNAAGGVNPDYVPGDMVIIKDHIDFSSIVGLNPLTGQNDERFGTRFPAMTNTYDKNLRALAKKCATELGYQEYLREGIYFHAAGPVYETPATTVMLRQLGCDVEGMSTTPEAIVAKHLDMAIFAISLITDPAMFDTDSDLVSNHEEVLRMANLRAPFVGKILEAMLKKL